MNKYIFILLWDDGETTAETHYYKSSRRAKREFEMFCALEEFGNLIGFRAELLKFPKNKISYELIADFETV